MGIGDIEGLTICPPGFYCPKTGMTAFKGYHCSPGFYCPAGSTKTNEVPCPEGTYSDSYEIFDSSQCYLCPPGYKCGAGSTSTSGIIECPLNQICPYGAKLSQNIFCPQGTYTPFTKSKSINDCFPCPYGSNCLPG
jgi:hypothetical protein